MKIALLLVVSLAPSTWAEHSATPAWCTYPVIARKNGTQGTVILKVSVRRDGTTSNIKVLSGPPTLAENAKDSLRDWTFQAADGAEEIEVTFIYVLDETVKGQRMDFDNKTKTVTIAASRLTFQFLSR